MYVCIYIYMTERTHRRHPATESAHAYVPRRRQLLTRACRKSRGRAGPEAVFLLPAAGCTQRPAHAPRTPPVAVTAGAGLRADAANGPVGNIRVLNTSAGVEGAPAGPACARPVPRTPVCDWRPSAAVAGSRNDDPHELYWRQKRKKNLFFNDNLPPES